LLGGEDALGLAMLEGLEDLQVTARIGIANTRRAARGFARHARQNLTISQSDRESQQTARLPMEALDLTPDTLTSLRRLGLKTIGDLSGFKSSELARRFSVKLPLALSDNGASYISGEVKDCIRDNKMSYVRGAPYNSQTQGE